MDKKASQQGEKREKRVQRTLEEEFPSSVMAVRFARARASEIHAINAGALQRSNGRGGLVRGNPAGGGGKRTFQRLPRYLRRRAMSHNVHRIPAQYRNRAEKEMLKTYGPKAANDAGVRAEILRNKLKPDHKKIRRSRRYQRRPGHILHDMARRQRVFGWLRTHIWHAKRMFMAPLWGLKLARRRTDRGLRASYRCGAFLCTAHDASYMACLQVDGPSQESVAAAVSQVAYPPGVLTSAVHRRAGRAGSCVLHRRGEYPMGALCPAEFQWRPQPTTTSSPITAVTDGAVSGTLWLWVHPAAKADVLAELSAVTSSAGSDSSVTVRERSDLLRFEIAGPRSSAVLHAVLKPTPSGTTTSNSNDSEENGVVKELFAAFPCVQSPDTFPSGTILAFTVSTPPAAPVGVALRPRRVSPPALAGTALAKLFSRWDAQAAATAASPLWAPEATALQQWGACTAVTGHETSPDVVATIPPTLPAMLVQRPGSRAPDRQGLGAGWTLVAPGPAAMRLWLALVYAGAHAIGFEEREGCDFEGGAPVFPRDWPDTPAARTDAAEHARAEEESYAKRPPAKRPNYDKLAVKRPFVIDWAALGVDPNRMFVARSKETLGEALRSPCDPRWKNALVMGSVRFPAKGRPAPRALLCIPVRNRNDPGADDIARTVRTKKGRVDSVGEEEAVMAPPADIPLDRKVAGFVTSGSFSYTAKAGRAIGFCSLRLLAPLLISKKGDSSDESAKPTAALLLRNITSKHYFAVNFVPSPLF